MGGKPGEAMTQQELDALPECGGIDYEDMGSGVIRPKARPDFALWTEETEPFMLTDQQGRIWHVGWAKGRQWKRRIEQR